MIDFGRIIGFDWDGGNATKSAEKHGVAGSEAEQVFFNQPLIVVVDWVHSESERRFHALGRTDESRRLHITFTLRSDEMLIRVISARDMSEKEKRRYEQDA